MNKQNMVPPARMARLIERARQGLYRLYQRSAPPQVTMMELMLAGWGSQALHAAAELGVADALADGPLSGDELAQAVGADVDALERLLRALISRGVFRRQRNGKYALNPKADTLRADAQTSLRGAALFYGSPQHREHWSYLADSVRTGKAIVPGLRGQEFFEYLNGTPGFGEVFHAAMTSVSALAEGPIAAAYDFGAHRTIIDVGGGHGRLLAAILSKTPKACGVLYDLADVVAGAPELLSATGVADRVRIESGSFFESVPAGGDLYVLKNIIHDWSDEQAQRILTNVRAASRADATVHLVEIVIPDDDRDSVGKWIDLEMLLCVNGRERTEAQYRELLRRSGFTMSRIIPTAAPFSLIEAKPA